MSTLAYRTKLDSCGRTQESYDYEAEAERVQDLLEKGWCHICPVEELCKQKLHLDWCLERHLFWPPDPEEE